MHLKLKMRGLKLSLAIDRSVVAWAGVICFSLGLLPKALDVGGFHSSLNFVYDIVTAFVLKA